MYIYIYIESESEREERTVLRQTHCHCTAVAAAAAVTKWVYFLVAASAGADTGACMWCSNHNSDRCCGTGSRSAFCPMPLCDMKYISNRFLHPLGLHKLCDVYTYKKRAVALFFSAAACVKKKTKKDYRWWCMGKKSFFNLYIIFTQQRPCAAWIQNTNNDNNKKKVFRRWFFFRIFNTGNSSPGGLFAKQFNNICIFALRHETIGRRATSGRAASSFPTAVCNYAIGRLPHII